MRLYPCQYCSSTLSFDATRCERCHSALGYWAETDTLCVLEPAGRPETFRSWAVPGHTLRRCANGAHGVCNWLVDAERGGPMCTACRHNRIIPDVSLPWNRDAWRKIEAAKHRHFHSLHRLGLVGVIERAGGAGSLGFQFLDDPVGGPPVMTGHAGGLITIAVKEANDAEREHRRGMLGEPYRTLLGHFRHESGHYFWDRLVRDTGRADECREVFGDHTVDYAGALQAYYLSGPPPGWQSRYVSAYAAMHPWEDFAETWAHYLHILATLDTAYSYQLRMAPRSGQLGIPPIACSNDPYEVRDIADLVATWLPLAAALNALNSSLGKDDAYPFGLPPPVVDKLGYVHRIVREEAHAAVTDLAALVAGLSHLAAFGWFC